MTVLGNVMLLECDPTPPATRYLFRARIGGIQSKYKLVASGVAPMAKLEDVPVGLQFELIVQAVNGNSQSVSSDPITFSVLPPAAVDAPTPAPSQLTRR